MTEEEWLTSGNVEELLYGLCNLKHSTSRVPAYVATFSESGRVRRLLSPEMQVAFDDYVRWAYEGGPNPATIYPEFAVFDPLEKQIIDAWDLAHDLRKLIGFPPGSWFAASSFVMAEAYNEPHVGQWHRKPNADTATLLQNSTTRLRDVVGNPFRPVTFSPSWRTDTAVSLARQMYESREFGAMPILADALQDAGCDNDAILTHCRDASATHVRGCWVVDLVLGKE